MHDNPSRGASEPLNSSPGATPSSPGRPSVTSGDGERLVVESTPPPLFTWRMITLQQGQRASDVPMALRLSCPWHSAAVIMTDRSPRRTAPWELRCGAASMVWRPLPAIVIISGVSSLSRSLCLLSTSVSLVIRLFVATAFFFLYFSVYPFISPASPVSLSLSLSLALSLSVLVSLSLSLCPSPSHRSTHHPNLAVSLPPP